MAKTFIILSDTMGSGDEQLGRTLMKSFLGELARTETAPQTVMFANTGVRLTCEGSDSLDDLAKLEERGVRIGSCGTCLKELGCAHELRVGFVGAMPDSVAMLCGDTDVVTIA